MDTHDKRWYITVGEPGGEYAVKAESSDAVWEKYARFTGYYITGGGELISRLAAVKACGADPPPLIRPAPPELAEWLDNITKPNPESKHPCRYKVPGGWIYYDEYQGGPCETFVPVALAAGITVIGEGE